MVFVSVTRLRIRSPFFVLPFLWHALKSSRQAERAAGFVGGKILQDARSTFWTMTLWKDDQAMNAYRTSGAHRDAMPKLLNWCDEAAVVHWTPETTELASWEESFERLQKEGRLSKVNRPSAAHLAHKFLPPKARRTQRILASASSTGR